MTAKKNKPAAATTTTTPPGVPADEHAARQQLARSAVPAEHHDEVVALKAPLEARGQRFDRFVEILGKVGEHAPEIIAIIKDLLPAKKG